MDYQIKSSSDDSDFLSKSYNNGVERIVGLKYNTEYTVSKEVLKKRKEFWDDLCNRYSKPFSTDREYDIATLKCCKPLNFVQHWINTSYLPYKAQVEEAKNPANDMLLTEDESSNSLLFENPNECNGELCCDSSSLSSSIDTTAYILSNMNTTNKVETMAILEGAKHNASPNQYNCRNVETVQFQKTMLDNNGNTCQAVLTTTPFRPSESLTQRTTNNLHKSIIKVPTDPVNGDSTMNCNSEHDEELFNAEEARAFNASRKCSNATYVGQRSIVNEGSTLEENISKLSNRKKLYSGRDSPVDLVNTTSMNKIVSINSTKNLHPALHPACRTSRKFTLRRKKQRSCFSVFYTSKLNKSISNVSNYKKHKRRTIARKHLSENSSIMDSSEKPRIPVAGETINNPKQNKSFAESSSSKELLSTESKLDNSVAQAEKFVNGVSEKSKHASTYLNPRIDLIPVTQRDIQKYRSSNKTTASPRDLRPVVRLIQLSDSDIEKYRKPNREATRPGSLSPVVQLKQLSECNNPECRISMDVSNVRFRRPVVRLKKLSEQDIKKYKVEIVRSEHSDTASVSRSSSNFSNISQPASNAVRLIGDSDSDGSTLLVCECNSPALQENRSPIVGASKNRNLRRKGTSNKYTGPNNSALYKTSETARNGFCRNIVMDSPSNSSCTVEGRSPRKNLKISASSLKTSTSVVAEEDVRQNDEAMSCSDESEVFNTNCCRNGANASKNAGTMPRSHTLLLSDEDDEFVNLIYHSKQRTNSKIRSLCNSPRKNSDNPVETGNVGKCTTKSMGAQLPSEAIGQNTKFEKQTAYLFRKRRSKNLLCLSKKETINRTTPVSTTRSKLPRAHGYKSDESEVALKGKRKLLTSMDIKRDKSRLHTLRFQTKIFDSDSESSYLS